MGYWITQFGTTALPARLQTQDVGAGPAYSGLVQLPGGGAYDALGAERSKRKAHTIKVSGAVLGDTAADLNAATAALNALIGERGALYRTPDGGTANSQWLTARLVDVQCVRDIRMRTHAELTLLFEVQGAVWHGAANNDTITLSSGTVSAEINNAGNEVCRHIIITVTAQTSAITALTIENLETGHVSNIKYSGTIAAGKSLIINTGTWGVVNDGTADYAHLTRESGHTTPEWLRLMPGDNTIRVTRTGGGATSTCLLSFYDEYA